MVKGPKAHKLRNTRLVTTSESNSSTISSPKMKLAILHAMPIALKLKVLEECVAIDSEQIVKAVVLDLIEEAKIQRADKAIDDAVFDSWSRTAVALKTLSSSKVDSVRERANRVPNP